MSVRPVGGALESVDLMPRPAVHRVGAAERFRSRLAVLGIEVAPSRAGDERVGDHEDILVRLSALGAQVDAEGNGVSAILDPADCARAEMRALVATVAGLERASPKFVNDNVHAIAQAVERD